MQVSGRSRGRPQCLLLLGSAIVLSAPALAQETPATQPAPAPTSPAKAQPDLLSPPQTEVPEPAQPAPTDTVPAGPDTAPPAQPVPAGPVAADPSAQTLQASGPEAAPVVQGTVRSITVRGNERLEPETILSYVDLEPGDIYDRNRLDQALKDLYATDLFADAIIRDQQGNLVVEVRENPVINRIILEGNERTDDDKIAPEIQLAPRQIFTRAKARADVARIVELYRRQGRFAASVEPMIVQLDQNRVDVVFEIDEGPKSKVRRINIIGNEQFSDGDLRGEIATREAKWYRIFTSNDTYDPDRSAYDQQVLRQFYLTEGFADFRVVSSVAELTADREDFILTYVIEEGERYTFGDIELESDIRDIKPEDFRNLIPIQKGDQYNARTVEDTITSLTETAGLLGYAFADVQPIFDRDRENRVMNVTFVIRETPRVYVERVDINGNTITKDQVIRREFRLAEGDPFNSVQVQRSRNRIQSLGFFQENLEIEQNPGSGPDKVVLEVNVEEQATGELQLSAGFSSLERFIVNVSIRQRNFRGLGQELRAAVNWSSYSQSIELGFTEPYLFGRNFALGGDVFRRDYNSFRFLGNGDRDTTYEQTTTGFQIRGGFPITEYWSAALRYGLSLDDITLERGIFYSDLDGDGAIEEDECDPLRAGRFLCDAVGNRTTSSVGYSIAFDDTDNRIRPSRGQRLVLNQDLAGVGGGVQYIRTRAEADKYWRLGRSGFIFNVGAEGGYIMPYGGDEIRINDRFFLGEPQIRGFDIRGVGPRVIRTPYVAAVDEDGEPILDEDGQPTFVPSTEERAQQDDALGGQAFYIARAELQIPLGASVEEMGIRPSAFVDVGALWDVNFDPETDLINLPFIERTGLDEDGNPITTRVPGFREEYFGDSPSPRVSVGFGVSWNSPFGPFRIDVAKALVKEPGDDTQLFQFNVGTAF